MRDESFRWLETDLQSIVKFGAALYHDPRELCEAHISRSLTPEAVRRLFVWKNGGELSAVKQKSVEANYVGRLEEVGRLPKDLRAEEFHRRWPKGGAIWRIL